MIPEGWTSAKLGNLVHKVGSGVTPKGGSTVYLESGIPLIRSQNVLWGKLDLSDVAFIADVQHEKMNSTKLIPRDVLLNITGASIGRSCVFPDDVGDANVNQHVCIIRTRKEKLVPFYLSCFLNSEFGQNQIDAFQAGGNRQGLNFEQIKSFPLHLPPLEEQVKIAEILTVWDDSLETLEKLIAAKLELKRGLMQELLTGKTRFQEFSDLKKWETKSLRELSSFITKGTTPSSIGFEFSDGNINFVKVESVTSGGKYIPGKFARISEATNHALKRSILKENDILFSIAGALGRTALVIDEILPANTNQAFAIIRLENENEILVAYLFQFLRSEIVTKYVEKISVTAAQPNISLGQLNGFEIPVPPLEEQKRIAEILSTLDLELEHLRAQLERVKTQKKGLMQQLLTGKIRVKV